MVGAAIIWKFVYEYKPDQPGVNQIGILNQALVWIGGAEADHHQRPDQHASSSSS